LSFSNVWSQRRTVVENLKRVLISKQGSLCAGPHNLVYETSPHPHW